MLNDTDILAEVITAFRAEQAEHRQAAGELLLELERDPCHPRRKALLDQLFREAHSLKGGARAAGLTAIEQLAHRIEDLFAAARDGRVELTPTVCDSVYAALDVLGALLFRSPLRRRTTSSLPARLAVRTIPPPFGSQQGCSTAS